MVERRALSAVRLGGDPMTVSAGVSCVGARVAVAARSAWTAGAGSSSLARAPGRAAGGAAVLHHRRPQSRPVLVERRAPGRVPSPPPPRPVCGGALRRISCATHVVELAREGRVAQRHPAPARPCQPRHDQHLFAGHRTEEIIATVHARRAPMMSATAGLQLRPTRGNGGAAVRGSPVPCGGDRRTPELGGLG
jgi:hypothetical protein